MESTTQKRPVSKFVVKIVEEEQERTKTLLSSFLDSYRHPISQAIEVIQNIQPSIQQAMEIAQQHFKAIEQALETYQNWIKIMREAYDQFINFIKSFRWPNFFKNIWQHVQNFVVSFLLAEYHQLHRARDRTSEEDIIILSYAYPIEFRRFCKMTGNNQSKSARIEFATHFLEALELVDKRYPLDEANLLSTLQRFFFRLGLILRDLLRKVYREFQKTFAREKSAEECTVYYQDKKYLLIPSLSALTNISEATLRRYASKGKFDAVKLPYISTRSGQKNMAWHFLYTPELISQLKRHYSPKKDNLLSRKQVSQKIGIHYDTLRSWEKKQIVTVIHKAGKVMYQESQLDQLIEIFKSNNSPRYRSLVAKAR
jgi:hypothetical protein